MSQAKYIGRHTVPTVKCNPCVRVLKRYAKAHKPVHVAVVVFIFCLEVVALITTHEIMIHLGLSTSITAWEMAVITLAEE